MKGILDFTDFNQVFPVVVLVFDFDEFSEGVLHGYLVCGSLMNSARQTERQCFVAKRF
jgi:hypothetical protein